MPLQGWTNTSWDSAATGGVYRPAVEKMEVDQLERLREEDPSIDEDRAISPISALVGLLFMILVVAFILAPKHMAAIFS